MVEMLWSRVNFTGLKIKMTGFNFKPLCCALGYDTGASFHSSVTMKNFHVLLGNTCDGLASHLSN